MILARLTAAVALLVSAPAFAQDAETFTPEQVREDFASLYDTLAASAYDLFAETSRAEFDMAHSAMLEEIDAPMTRFEAEMLFQRFAALAHQGHVRVESDFSGFFAHLGSGGIVFPLDIAIDEDRMLVAANGSSETAIARGDAIIAIEGVAMTDLLPRLTQHISADTPRFARTLLEIYMPLVVWLELPDAHDAYDVTVRHEDDREVHYTLTPGSGSGEGPAPFSLAGRDARMLTETTAYLRPGAFSLTDEEGGDLAGFLAFVDSAFADFADAGATALILDLRDNPGGDNALSDPIVAYFANKPFRFSSDFRVRVSAASTAANARRLASGDDASTETSQRYADLYAQHENGDVVTYPLPFVEPRVEDRFDGGVFVLVNRYSYSNAVTTAALIQDYGFGTIMGETTADMATTHGAMERFELPHTGIVVAYPKAFIVRPSGDETVAPLTPDVTLTSPRIRSDEDVMLRDAIAWIESWP